MNLCIDCDLAFGSAVSLLNNLPFYKTFDSVNVLEHSALLLVFIKFFQIESVFKCGVIYRMQSRPLFCLSLSFVLKFKKSSRIFQVLIHLSALLLLSDGVDVKLAQLPTASLLYLLCDFSFFDILQKIDEL